MKKLTSFIAIILMTASLASCANKTTGTIGGAAVGGVAGGLLTHGNPVGIAAGAIGGGVIGNQLSR